MIQCITYNRMRRYNETYMHTYTDDNRVSGNSNSINDNVNDSDINSDDDDEGTLKHTFNIDIKCV